MTLFPEHLHPIDDGISHPLLVIVFTMPSSWFPLTSAFQSSMSNDFLDDLY